MAQWDFLKQRFQFPGAVGRSHRGLAFRTHSQGYFHNSLSTELLGTTGILERLAKP